MAWIETLQVTTVGEDPAPLASGTLMMTVDDGTPTLVLLDRNFGLLHRFAIGAEGELSTPVTVTLDEEIPVAAAGNGAALAWPVVESGVAAWDAGAGKGVRVDLGASPAFATSAVMLAADLESGSMVFLARPGSGPPTAYSVEDGALSLRGTGAAHPYADGISSFALIETQGAPYLYAGSASAHGIAGYRVLADGGLDPVDGLGMDESLPVAEVTALASARSGGTDFLIAGAMGTSSLTVMEVAETGALTPTDHVIDTLDTRFDAVTQVATARLGERSYVIAGGDDDGMSVFALTPQGRLVHLESVADTLDMPLADLSGIAAAAAGSALHIYVTSGSETGVGHFKLDAGASGTTATGAGPLEGGGGDDMLTLTSGDGSVDGGAGDDILSDGPGEDRLSGGPGRDIFVPAADGERDIIEDVTPGEDMLDLSQWPFFHSAEQLEIETTEQGADLRYGAEDLVLRTPDQTPLEPDDVAALLMHGPSRVPLELAPLETAPEPEPPAAPPPPPQQPPAQSPTPPDETPPPLDDPPDPPPATPPEAGMLLTGTADADLLEGGPANDTLSGASGPDTLHGADGDDMIAGADGDDMIEGGPGDDMIGGGPGQDTILGGPGDDVIGAGTGADIVDGGPGRDALSGGPGDDTLRGGDGADTIGGSYGDDLVMGEEGDDSLGGGTGQDTLEGGTGDDSIGGGEGDDVIDGGAGDDFLAGGGRDDVIMGGAGNDTINGGDGDDTMTGGEGADVFVYNFFKDGDADVITDFEDGLDTFRMIGIENAPGSGLQGYLAALDIADTAEGALMSYQGHGILVEDVAAADLGQDDFIFI